MRILPFFLTAALVIATTTPGDADMTDEDIRQGYLEHGALAQFHRWFLLYERPETGITNALDILTNDVVVTSGLGTAQGHDQYAARVAQLPDSWQNAHHVSDLAVAHGQGGGMRLTARIDYQNIGMLPDGAQRQAYLRYTVDLEPGDGALPQLAAVTITQEAELAATPYVDAYAENRMRSLVHAWLAAIEDPARDPDPVRELLADRFTLNFSSGAITDFDGFASWLAGPGSQVAASTHVLSNFGVAETGPGRYELRVDFDWTGLLPDGTALVARTRHSWQVTNDPADRFARITRMDVEVVEPFRPRGG